MAEIVMSVVLFLIAGVNFFVSYRSFREQGFLINNSYIYATKQVREFMNKKPYYRQSGIVFSLIGVVFALNGLEILLKAEWIFYLVIATLVLTVVYAILSSILMHTDSKNTDCK